MNNRKGPSASDKIFQFISSDGPSSELSRLEAMLDAELQKDASQIDTEVIDHCLRELTAPSAPQSLKLSAKNHFYKAVASVAIVIVATLFSLALPGVVDGTPGAQNSPLLNISNALLSEVRDISGAAAQLTPEFAGGCNSFPCAFKADILRERSLFSCTSASQCRSCDMSTDNAFE